MATKAKKLTYIATNIGGYDTSCFEGTLEDILSSMEDNDQSPDDYLFYRAERVDVKFVKKLVLEEVRDE